jgi:hypothetical protein
MILAPILGAVGLIPRYQQNTELTSPAQTPAWADQPTAPIWPRWRRNLRSSRALGAGRQCRSTMSGGFGGSQASIGGVAASHVLVGPPRRGSMRSIVRFLDRLSDLGAGPEDSDDERLRHGTLIFASMVITLISLTWVATYFAYGYPTSAAIPALYQLITVVGLVVLARTRRFGVFRTTQLIAFLVLPALLQASLGGFVASSAMILWAIFTPLAALALQGLRRSVVWFVAFFAELVVLGLLDPRLSQDPAALPTGLVITFFVLNVMGLTLSAYVMLGYFVEQRERARRALEAERERSERLLLNVLPGPIAERLKVGTGVIADHYDTVSVLFADLVGFTERSLVLAADELVALLDEILCVRPARRCGGCREDQDDRRRLYGGGRVARATSGPPRGGRPHGAGDAG